MSVPGYYGCDCDKYNPDCRCYPKEERPEYESELERMFAERDRLAVAMRRIVDIVPLETMEQHRGLEQIVATVADLLEEAHDGE